jgi:dimeric dUTPase (all-alpha-NTP-PPase superfamily)
MNWNLIYENNKRLDKIYFEKYGSNELRYKQNCIELLVELGEFLNETKIFKYWSIKKPDKEKVLEELADVITMILYFYNIFNINTIDIKEHINSNDCYEVINYLYDKMSNLMHEKTNDLIIDIFSNTIYLSKLLNIKEKELLNAIDKKHKILKERLESDY